MARPNRSRRDRRARLRSVAASGVPLDVQEPITVSAGEGLMVLAETGHSVRNTGGGSAAEVATDVVEKGKPFLVIVD